MLLKHYHLVIPYFCLYFSALIPVTEQVCQKFIKRKCFLGWPVLAKFPIPSPCGCNGKQGSLEIKKFLSLCELQKYAAECNKRKLMFV